MQADTLSNNRTKIKLLLIKTAALLIKGSPRHCIITKQDSTNGIPHRRVPLGVSHFPYMKEGLGMNCVGS